MNDASFNSVPAPSAAHCRLHELYAAKASATARGNAAESQRLDAEIEKRIRMIARAPLQEAP